MTQVRAEQRKLSGTKVAVAILGLCENEKGLEKRHPELGVKGLRFLKDSKFTGKKDKMAVYYPAEGGFAKRIIFVGLGPEKQVDLERIRQAAATAIRAVREMEEPNAAFCLESFLKRRLAPGAVAEALSEAALLALYRFDKYKTREDDHKKDGKEVKEIRLLFEAKKLATVVADGIRFGTVGAQANALARDLVNEPADVLYPESYAKRIKQICTREGLACRVLGVAEMKRERMNGILQIGKGSAHEPRFVIVEYNRSLKKKPFALVGKGVTFDSGGIDIKPSSGMEKMKYDMSGSAICLAAVVAAKRLKLPMRLVALLPLVENMPSGTAGHPGDIVKMRNGLTVNVLNTDAEGRLVVADALDYAKSLQPQAVVDVATLTGACYVVFGERAIGLMGTSPQLVRSLFEAGQATFERCWELPLWEDYEEELKDDVADLKNIGEKGAGTITAGKFLSNFIKDVPWAHLDIASCAWITSDRGYFAKGPTAMGVRLLVKMLREMSKSSATKIGRSASGGK